MNFASIFTNRHRVLSFEFFPPKKEAEIPGTKALMAQLAKLNPDFMTVTYGALGGTRDRTKELTAYIAQELAIPAVAHLTCVGHSEAAIDQVLDELRLHGISHVLALRGDPPRGVEDFEPHPEGFHCARDLAAHIARRGDFSIAVAGYPETHPEAASPLDDIAYLKEKVDAGAEVIITQLFFEADHYFKFRDRCDRAGIHVPIIPGLMPIRNLQQVKRFTEMCGATVPAAITQYLEEIEGSESAVLDYGVEVAVNLAATLLEGGAPGLHLYTLNKSFQVEQVVNQLAAYWS